MEHTVLSTHSDTSRDDYDSRGNIIPPDCDVVSGIGQSTNCEEEFNLSLPEAEFQDTHNLESIAADVVLAYEVSAGVRAQDSDFGASGPGCDLTTFSDCRIDLSLSYSDTVHFRLETALGGLFAYEATNDISVRCQSDNSDLFGLGLGHCVESDSVAEVVGADLGVFSGVFLDVLMSQDLVLNYERSALAFILDPDDDNAEYGNSFSSSFFLNLTYTYVDKPVVSPPDVPNPAVVPLPAGLPLLAAGLMALGVLKRRQTGSRTLRS